MQSIPINTSMQNGEELDFIKKLLQPEVAHRLEEFIRKGYGWKSLSSQID